MEPTSLPTAAPESTPQNNSTIIARAEPLWPARASTVPARAAAASVVGRPSGSKAQPSGMRLPALWAAMMLPRATSEVAMSIRTGNPLPVGKDTASGFVPNIASHAPSGDMAGSQLVIAQSTRSCAAARLQ